eukprot:3059004-Rhodomonas_salina.1
MKYEGILENVNTSFIQEYNETTTLGLRSSGASRLHIGEINRQLKLHLEAATKAFTTVQELSEHMLVCSLVKVIKDWALGTGQHANAWKLAENMIIAARNVISTGTLISLTLVEAAIALAQRHLSELPPEEI